MPRRLHFSHAGFKLLAIPALIALPLFFAAGQTDKSKPSPSSSDANLLPDGPGKDVVLKKCQSCHSIRTVISRHGTEDDWAQEVTKMIGRGATISDDEGDTIVDYLAAHFGPSSSQPGEHSPSTDNSKPNASAAQ
jgi:mono/diheme cytochrome c family protein